MLKHCHSRSGFPTGSPTSISNSLSSLECSQSSGSEVSFDASFGSSCTQSPVPSDMSSRGSLTSSEPHSMCSSSSSPPSNSRVSIKVFASCLRPDIEYKTLCVSHNTRSRELIWQLLAKFKMKHRDPKLFYLTMDIVISKAGEPVSRTLVLDEDARPAELALCNPWGECRFTLQMKKGGLVRIHDSVLMNESQYKSLLISEDTTVEDVVRILLHCYNLERFQNNKFSLYEHCKTQNYERKLNYEDRPLSVQDSWLDPSQFRLVLRRTPNLVPRRGSIHQLGLPSVPVHSHATTDMGARAIQANLVERYSKFCQKYESYFYV
ncbi:uncharacterized protein LOC111695143 [Eurytemora carolleeae]|uniref:uncharacterized protein LOC111695143 n=1 Tax=Eurytemora carolleeae TaxID=1294199 RepID=UPI000C7748AA|nr:uncharacterized protein LOC111695143 [Eurytemora carolleeae]|eukprot:XP_023320123.1 uncharacterized protein LOC111695143 [Eurytemora affinis]